MIPKYPRPTRGMVDDNPLHRYIRICDQMPWPKQEWGAAWLAEIEKALDNGIEPNQTNHEGNTPLGLAAVLGANKDREWMPEGARLLLKRGANPLQKDQALLLAYTEESDHKTSYPLAPVIMEWLAEQEDKGDPVRCEKGGNYLHVLSQSPRALVSALHSYANMQAPSPDIHYGLIMGLRKKDGASLLHTLWDPKNSRADANHNNRWMACQILLNDVWQLDPMIKDRKGITGAQLIQAAVKKHGIPDFAKESWSKIQAAMEYDQLEKATPSTATKSKRTPRL